MTLRYTQWGRKSRQITQFVQCLNTNANRSEQMQKNVKMTRSALMLYSCPGSKGVGTKESSYSWAASSLHRCLTRKHNDVESWTPFIKGRVSTQTTPCTSIHTRFLLDLLECFSTRDNNTENLPNSTNPCPLRNGDVDWTGFFFRDTLCTQRLLLSLLRLDFAKTNL